MKLFDKQESRLVKACKANDRNGQEALYKLFYADMLRVCLRYLKNDNLAQEALNGGFLKVFQNIADFDDKKGELGGWIRVIIVRTCIDLGRKEAKFTELDYADDEPEIAFIAPDVLDKLYAEDLLKAVRSLPTATQLVFNLYVIDGFSHKEIADKLHIGESTSRWHLTQAKKTLKTLLASFDPDQNGRLAKQKKAT